MGGLRFQRRRWRGSIRRHRRRAAVDPSERFRSIRDRDATRLRVRPSAAPASAERALSLRIQQPLVQKTSTGRKIWEFDANLHRSIIRTCLSNAELRHILVKLFLVKLSLNEAATATDYELHTSGVLIAGNHTESAKLLRKALDRRHRVAINRFAR